MKTDELQNPSAPRPVETRGRQPARRSSPAVRKVCSIIGWSLFTVVAIWVVADYAHSRLVARWVDQWQSRVSWNREGVRAGCESYTVGSGDAAILLIHGINNSPRCYDRTAARLAEAGFTCRVMRLPGFSEPLPKFASVTRHDWCTAVDSEVQRLRGEHDRVYLVAHSLGGAVALSYLRDNPRAVEAVALLAPAVAVSDRRSPLLPARAWHEVARRILLFTDTAWSPFELDCHDPANRGFPWRMPYVPLSVIDELFQLLDDNRKRPDQLKTPLLMVLTKSDEIVDWKAAQAFFEQAAAESKSLCFLENSGHEIPLDYQWHIAADEIESFFRASR